MNSRLLKTFAWSLGCPKNRVDTERLLGSLNASVELVDNPRAARLVFVNTCAFIESATRESLDAILQTAMDLGKKQPGQIMAVAGCLPSRYEQAELRKEIPEVDIWLDSRNFANWARIINKALQLDGQAGNTRFCERRSYAWLKICDGCDHKCAYCAIPLFKGKLQSLPAPLLINEAKELLAAGVKEIILVGQDVTAWGNDLPDYAGKARNSHLTALLRELADLRGLEWLRLLYLYPDAVSGDLIDGMAAIGKPLLPYFDLPFQHASPRILRKMGRSAADPRLLVRNIRKTLPDAALRATFMTGFPGETEQDFKILCDCVAEARFTHMGVFCYENEAGTRASGMPGQVPEAVKIERKNTLMEIQRKISREFLAEFVGRQVNVLADENCGDIWPGLYKGRAWFMAPEIDGDVYISGGNINIGQMASCEILDSGDYEMSGIKI